MPGLWDKVKDGAKKAGAATKLAATKTKLRTDMILIDREMEARKKAFGVTMYDYVSPLTENTEFYAADDDLTRILRPHIVEAQREISALDAKRSKHKEKLASKEAARAAAFAGPKAETAGQKIANFGKAGAMKSNEAKIKAEVAMVDRQVKALKGKFGTFLYYSLAEAEDTRGYLPPDRQIRSIYDTCRQDLQAMEARKKGKEEELVSMGGSVNDPAPAVPPDNASTAGATGSSTAEDAEDVFL